LEDAGAEGLDLRVVRGRSRPGVSGKVVAVSHEGPYLARLVQVLEQRGIPVEAVLPVATAVGVDNIFLGVGTLSGR